MYTLEFYAPDGDSVREGTFNTIQEAIDRWCDIGSRWIFYPIGVVFTPGGRVAAAPDGLEFLEGRYRKAFESNLGEIL